MIVQESAAIAVACIFFLYLIGAVANFRLTKFRLYLLSSLSCVLRLIGFSFNASFYSKLAGGHPPDTAFSSVFFVLTSAGQAIAFAVHIIVMTCWFKNASKPAQPPYAAPLNMRILIRWLIFPFIVFGPILGICYVTLVFGYPSSSHTNTGNIIRHIATWGVWSCSLILITVIITCYASARTSPKRGNVDPALSKDKLILISIICCILLFISITFNVISTYHSKFVLNPDFYYPLIVLPALIEQLIITIPRLLAKIAMAARYDEFCQERDALKVEKKMGGLLNVFKTFQKKDGEGMEGQNGGEGGAKNDVV